MQRKNYDRWVAFLTTENMKSFKYRKVLGIDNAQEAFNVISENKEINYY